MIASVMKSSSSVNASPRSSRPTVSRARSTSSSVVQCASATPSSSSGFFPEASASTPSGGAIHSRKLCACERLALVVALRPEVLDALRVRARVLRLGGDHDHDRVVRPLVPYRAGHLRRHAHDRALGHVDHLVLELELERPGRHEVELFLGLVAVPVASLAARERWHPPPGEAHLLGAEVARGAHPHLARVVAEDVRYLFKGSDLVAGHAGQPTTSYPRLARTAAGRRAFRRRTSPGHSRARSGGGSPGRCRCHRPRRSSAPYTRGRPR